MNRREALAALVSLPAVARIQTADLKPDDVLVVECDDYVSEQGVANIRAALEQIWPGRKVAVMDKGTRLKVLPG